MAEIRSLDLRNKTASYEMGNGLINLIVYPRIHMFSLDLSTYSGSMRTGSMGASLLSMPIDIKVSLTVAHDRINSHYSGDIDVVEILNKLRTLLNQEVYWDVTINYPTELRPHIGLGSSTQVLGGVLLCAAKCCGAELSYLDLFRLGLGHASALGLSLLSSPGFIIENGYKISEERNGLMLHPKIYQEFEVPTGSLLTISGCHWFLIIGFPTSLVSLSGSIELSFWDDILPDRIEASRKITYTVLTNIIPGLIENDFGRFINGFLEITTQGIKQKEESIQADETMDALKVLRDKFDFAAVSSLGPTVYTFSDDDPTEMLDGIKSVGYEFKAIQLGINVEDLGNG